MFYVDLNVEKRFVETFVVFIMSFVVDVKYNHVKNLFVSFIFK